MDGLTRALQPAEALARVRDGSLILIDVREHHEGGAVVVPAARRLPLSALPASLAELPDVSPVAFICLTGRRAAVAARLARDAGFEAHNTAGGLLRWCADGLPVERD